MFSLLKRTRSALAALVLMVCGALSLVVSETAVSARMPAARRGARAASGPAAVLVAFREPAPMAARVNAVRQLGLQVDPHVQSRYFARLLLPPGAQADG